MGNLCNWIQSEQTGLIVGIVTGVVSSLIVAIAGAALTRIYWCLKIRKSEYSGIWRQEIYENNDYSGRPIKVDEYEIKHKKLLYSGKLTVNITGKIHRKEPANEDHRWWDFVGYLDGDILTILYQSIEGQKSRGCIYVKLSHQNGQDDFRGFYLEEHIDGKVDKTPLIIKKVRN